MKKLGLIILLVNLFSYSIAQTNPDRTKAEKAVTKYLTEKHKTYKPISFGECFNQTYPAQVQDKLKTKKPVAYSLVHTYNIGSKKITDMYFHLDKNYEVVGQLTDAEMMEITTTLLQKSGKFDSILNNLTH